MVAYLTFLECFGGCNTDIVHRAKTNIQIYRDSIVTPEYVFYINSVILGWLTTYCMMYDKRASGVKNGCSRSILFEIFDNLLMDAVLA